MEFPNAIEHNAGLQPPYLAARTAQGFAITLKALILAGDTDGNIGDLAIVTATCERLRSIDPAAEIALLTNFPERDRRRLGIVPLKRGIRGLPGLIRAVRRADVVICGCGGLFQDDDSLLKMPYWALRLALLRPFAKRMVGLSIGAGPLDHPISKLFGRLALKTLNPISVRDHLALEVLQPLTRKSVTVVPDPAFTLRASSADRARQALQDAGVPAGKRLVGVAVRRWFHTDSNLVPHKYASKIGLYRNRGKAQMISFIESTAKVLDDVIADSNTHVVFMPTYNVDHENDAAVCEAIGAKLPAGSFSILELDDPALYKAVSGQLTVMLCGRMHPAILAASMGTPVVGIAYNPKFYGMFAMLGQRSRCLCIDEFTRLEEIAKLTAILQETVMQPDSFKPDTLAIERQTRQYIEKLVPLGKIVRARNAVPQTERH